MEASNGLNPFLSWDTSVAGIQDEILGLGYASRLSGGVPLAGMLNGALGEPEPWSMALDAGNTLQEARSSLPCKPITAMEVFYASQLAYNISMAPAGADNNINYFFWLQLYHFLSYEASWGFLLHKGGCLFLFWGDPMPSPHLENLILPI